VEKIRAIGIHKEKWGSHALFSEEGKYIASKISLEFTFSHINGSTFITIFNLHGNTSFGKFLNSKSSQQCF